MPGWCYPCVSWAGECHHEVGWLCDEDARVEMVEAEAMLEVHTAPECGSHVADMVVQPAQCEVVERV